MSEFDVFLCHNSQDKPEVIKIARQLQQQKLKPWLDIWELPPGVSWQECLEEQIEQIKSAAVFVGNSGSGPWQKREMRAFLSEFVERGVPVIPVLLEDAPQEPELPVLLQDLTWVDFRHAESNPMGRLIWGITQTKPKDFDSFKVSITNSLEEVMWKNSQAQSFTENLGNSIDLDLVLIPGGIFMMGSPEGEGRGNEKPQHKVAVQSFLISKYPITQTQYLQIINKNPSKFKGEQRPVECVTWEDAVEFCQILSKQTGKEYRLPSEAEWEYACRAGTIAPFYFGSKVIPELVGCKTYFLSYIFCSLCLYFLLLLHRIIFGESMKLEKRATFEVGQFPPNAFGLYDMHGNVCEWCLDDWHIDYEGAPQDGSAWISGFSIKRVARGGSWNHFPNGCRSSSRLGLTRAVRYTTVGFRVVCVVFSDT